MLFVRGLDNKLGVGDIAGFDWNISEFDKSDGEHVVLLFILTKHKRLLVHHN